MLIQEEPQSLQYPAIIASKPCILFLSGAGSRAMADFDPTDYDGQNADDPLNDGEDELGKGPQARLGKSGEMMDLGLFWDFGVEALKEEKELHSSSFARTSCS